MFGEENKLIRMKNKNAFKIAKRFKEQNEKPKGTSIVKVPEFGEDAVFKSFFVDFYCLRGINLDSEVSAHTQMEEIFINKQSSNFDINTGPAKSITTYVVENEELVQLPDEEHGHFYEDNIYIIDAHDSNSRRFLYLWVGNKKTLNEMQS